MLCLFLGFYTLFALFILNGLNFYMYFKMKVRRKVLPIFLKFLISTKKVLSSKLNVKSVRYFPRFLKTFRPETVNTPQLQYIPCDIRKRGRGGSMFVCVCVCVSATTATPFNLEVWNFGIAFIMWISKNGFLKFLKKYFYAELLPFFYISLRFLCNFEEQLRQNKWI